MRRRKAILQLKKESPQHILDVATGTADMALLAAKMLKPKKITGIDISEHMLAMGRQKVEKEGLEGIIELQNGDGETIKFNENSFDAVMVAFGVRNFENLEKGLSEIFRVLKPGGQLVILEFSKPVVPFVKIIYHFYMGRIAPQLAGWFTKNKQAYQYLDKSARAFPDRNVFADIIKNAGYTNTFFKPLSLGICCIYAARKP